MKLYLFAALVVICNLEETKGCHGVLNFIDLDHQRMVLDHEQKIFALKNSSIQMCTSFILSLYQDCGTNLIHQWNINSSNQVVLPVNDFINANTPLLLTTHSSNCPLLQLRFVLAPEVTTEQVVINPLGFTCLNFNTETYSGPLYLVLPTINICEPDCVCSIILFSNENCLNFHQCPCIMDTHFSKSLRLCATSLTNLQLCVSNITDRMNNTNVHLYTQRYSNCAYSYRKYVKAFRIIIGLTDTYTMSSQSLNVHSSLVSAHNFTESARKASLTPFLTSSQTMILFQGLNSSSTWAPYDHKSSILPNSLPYLIVGASGIICLLMTMVTTGILVALQRRKKKGINHIYDNVGVIYEHTGRSFKFYDRATCSGSPKMTPNPVYNYCS